MSTLTKIAIGPPDAFIDAANKIDALGIKYTNDDVSALYSRFNALGTYHDTSVTQPGIQGFDMALRTCLVLTGNEEHEFIPTFTDCESPALELVPRPFNFFVNEEKASADAEIAIGQQRGYRLGLYIIGKMSPLIEYINSSVPQGTERVIAKHVDGTNTLVGRHISSLNVTENRLNIGSGPGVFPANAKSVYSYSVVPVPEPTAFEA